MIGPYELLGHISVALDAIGASHFATGSIASMMYGEPRFTTDIDVVVRLTEVQVGAVVTRFPAPDWYISEDAARHAARCGGMFNIIHVPSGLKADLIIPSASPFDNGRFERTRELIVEDGRVERFASPEDVILKKLEFFRLGGSAKHMRDIDSMVRTLGAESLDWAYLLQWAETLGVVAELDSVRGRAGL